MKRTNFFQAILFATVFAFHSKPIIVLLRLMTRLRAIKLVVVGAVRDSTEG